MEWQMARWQMANLKKGGRLRVRLRLGLRLRGRDGALTLDPSPIRWARESADGVQVGFQVAGVAPGKGLEAKIEGAVQFVERDAHIEAGLNCSQATTPGLLHDWQAVDVEPTNCVSVN